MVARVILVGLGLALTVGLAGPLVVGVLVPDHEAPAEVERILPAAKRYLASQTESRLAAVRYVGWEYRRRDHLVVLRFEIREFPFIAADRAYLVSRCTPIEELDPDTAGMGGGRGILDFGADPELDDLRSDAQPACDGV